MSWLIDLDGVVWRGEKPIAGSADALHRLANAGIGLTYVTNNSAMTAQGYADKLAAMGAPVDVANIIHGGHAVSRLVDDDDRVLVCAGAGVVEALEARSIEYVHVSVRVALLGRFDSVIVGWLPDFSYDMLSIAVRSVLFGAELLAPSADPLYPASDGPKMGGGSLTMAVAYATKATPQFAAKPFQPMVDEVRARVPEIDLVVGDQAFTDGRLAQRLGVPFVHVATGVKAPQPGEGEESVPVAQAVPDLAAAVDWFLNS